MGDLSGELFGSSSESACEAAGDVSSGSLVESASEASSAAGDGSSESSDGGSTGTPRKRNDPGGDGVSDGDLRDIPPRGR